MTKKNHKLNWILIFSFFRRISSWSLSGQKPNVFFSSDLCLLHTNNVQLETKFNHLTFYWSQGNRLFTSKQIKRYFILQITLSHQTLLVPSILQWSVLYFSTVLTNNKQFRIFTVFVIVVWFRFIIFYC